MASVTQRIKEIIQPKNGYINPKNFNEIIINDFKNLYPMELENIHPCLVGLAVDYLTRFLTGCDKYEAFSISLWGAQICEMENDEFKYLDYVNQLISEISALDDKSIINACNVVQYDSYYRSHNPNLPKKYQLNNETIHNIRIMVQRSLTFFAEFDKKEIKTNITFEDGYTKIINAGDGDFMTKNTLWDFKVSKNSITKNHTLQIVIYWLLGLHSKFKNDYLNIKYLGFFNPRLNKKYLLDVNKIDQDIIFKIEKEVIGY